MLIGSELPTRELADLDARLPVVAVARKVRGVDAVRSDDGSAPTWPSPIWPSWATAPSPTSTAAARPVPPSGAAGFRKAAAALGISATVVSGGGLTEREGAAAAAAMLAAETAAHRGLRLQRPVRAGRHRRAASAPVCGFPRTCRWSASTTARWPAWPMSNLTTVGQDSAGSRNWRWPARSIAIDGPAVKADRRGVRTPSRGARVHGRPTPRACVRSASTRVHCGVSAVTSTHCSRRQVSYRSGKPAAR